MCLKAEAALASSGGLKSVGRRVLYSATFKCQGVFRDVQMSKRARDSDGLGELLPRPAALVAQSLNPISNARPHPKRTFR